MPETGAAIAAWWDGLGAAATVGEAAGGAAAVGEGATELGAGMALADEAGAGLGVDAATGLTEASAAPSATEGIIPNSGPASTPLAETPAATPTQTAAQNLIQPEELGQAHPVTEETPYGVNEGSGLQEAGAPASKGLLNSAMDWVNAKPVNTVLAGQAVGGLFKGASDQRLLERKLQAEREAREYPARLKQGNPSVGGGGVRINVAPGGKILRRPDGSSVYVPNSGLINGGMNGTRG